MYHTHTHALSRAPPTQVHLDPALEASKMTGGEKFVFGLHPHGVLSDYRILLDGVTGEHFPKVGYVRMQTTKAMHSVCFFVVGAYENRGSGCLATPRAS